MMKDLHIVDIDIADRELEAVQEVVKSRFLVEGKQAREFEKKFSQFTGAKYVSTVMNGTCALHLAMTALGIGPGDEVITTPFTFIASSNSIMFNGGIPIFVDVDPETYNIDPEKIEAAITPKTKAIMPVHILGNPCDMKAICDIAEDHHLIVIEDCAQAHDARIDDKHMGNFGALGCFSFYGTKTLIGGEGGAVITNNEEIDSQIKSLKNHGRNPSGGYAHYRIGYNYRITDLAAAIMNVQMDRSREILARRHRNGDMYRKLLENHPNLLIQKLLPHARPSDYIVAPVIRNPKISVETIIKYLKTHQIESRTIYSSLCYEQPSYHDFSTWPLARIVDYPDYSKVSCLHAEYIARHHFELPMVSSLHDDDIQYIVETLDAFFKTQSI